jgi:hypothetical protein
MPRPQDTKDPKGLYSTLGISETADVGDIRKAYRRLALRWHPDKNPDDPSATEHFQKISSAYEVLSDDKKRDMYDRTGCIDEEELLEGDAFDPNDLFAAFFGSMNEDLDDDEQAMFDDLLRMAGGACFARGRRRRGKKGRGGRKMRGGLGADLESFMDIEAMMSAMVGGMGAEIKIACPQGHDLKRRKAEAAEYECDVCQKDISTGKRFYDCRKCDFSMCQRCHKKAVEAAHEDSDDFDDDDEQNIAEMLSAFCEMHSTVVRQGKRLQHKCDICNTVVGAQTEVLPHMEEKHLDLLETWIDELAAHTQEVNIGLHGYPGSSGPTRSSGSRKKR